MKRIGLILLAILLVAFPLFSQTVNIPDANFLYNLIYAGVDANGDGLISNAEAEAVISLNVKGYRRPISDMTGIEAFINLDTLKCTMNSITSLDLSNNTALTYLDCSYSWWLTSLDLSNNTALTYLDCGGNQLTSLDLSNNTALINLVCYENQLTSLDLSNNTALINLVCYENQLTSLDLSNNTALINLVCYDNYFLNEICVWVSFPDDVTFDTTGCPNAFLTTECNTATVQINYSIRFGSTGDPRNGLTIGWQSEGNADSIAWGYTPELEYGEYLGVISTSILGTQFEYTFPTLTAGSTIHYAIYNSEDGMWTEERIYNTASDATDNRFSFSVIGDSRSYSDAWKKIAEATFDTDFTLFLGDIISSGADASDWAKWFDYGDKFVSRELIYHTIGNHDDDNSPSGSENFEGLYTLPGNELYYSFTYGNALFICLNSLRPEATEQYNWLLSTLEANKDQTWKIVFFHKPFYTSPSHTGEMDDYFNTWWKAFDEYGVDMIFNGHDHNYQRTKPINRNVSTTSPVENYGSGEGEGRCQIVAGSAGPLDGAAEPGLWWLENSESKRHFCNIDIDGGVLSFKVLDANQFGFDELVLDKSYVGINDFGNSNCSVYPNPTNDFVTLQLSEPGEYSFEITSVNGQIIQRRNFTGHSHQIDLSSFQKGVYFITIRSKDFVTTRKIIKL